MGLNLGATPVAALRLGSAAVSKVMLGANQVWPVAPPPGGPDPDAQAWIDYVAASDGVPLEAGVQAAAHKMFAALKLIAPNTKIRLVNFIGPRRLETMRTGLFTLQTVGTFVNMTDAHIGARWRGLVLNGSSDRDSLMSVPLVDRTYVKTNLQPGGMVAMLMQVTTNTSNSYPKPYSFPYIGGARWAVEVTMIGTTNLMSGSYRWPEAPNSTPISGDPTVTAWDDCIGNALSQNPPYIRYTIANNVVGQAESWATLPTITDQQMTQNLSLFNNPNREIFAGTYSMFIMINNPVTPTQMLQVTNILKTYRAEVAATLNPYP